MQCKASELTVGDTEILQEKKAELRKQEMWTAIKDAERAIEQQRFRIPTRKWLALSLDQRRKMLNDAMVAARAEARAELRKRWAEEDAPPPVELPAHITRLPNKRRER
jgi:uncharacterized protein (DUF934 family)